jgi:hypothetical protein
VADGEGWSGVGGGVMNRKKRTPGFVYWPVWLKQYIVLAVWILTVLVERYRFLSLFLVMFSCCCLLWEEQDFWISLIGGIVLGFIVAPLLALVGYSVLCVLCLLLEIVCAPFYFLAQWCGWKLPEDPERLAALAARIETEMPLKWVSESDDSGFSQELQRLKNQNDLLKVGLMLFGIDWLFDHFGDE